MWLKHKRKNYLKQVYKYTPETDVFSIDVSLDNYSEVFNGWDPSPIKRRDIEPELLAFIERCAYDIPLKYNTELNFYLPKAVFDAEKEDLTHTGILNNFKFTTLFIRRELGVYHRKIIVYIILFLTFLSLAYFFKKQDIAFELISATLVEGLFIGAWVFLWEAFSLFFFTSQEKREKLKRYNRFIRSKINFYYN